MKTELRKTGAVLLPAILILSCAGSYAAAQAAGQAAAGQAGAGQVPAGTGQIPPRDPRLPAPNVQETPPPAPIITPPPPTPTADVPNRPLGVEEAVRIGLRLQPNIAVAKAALRTQKGRTIQTRSALLPQADITAGYDYVSTISHAGTVGSSNVTGFTGAGALHQLIFDFNHTRDLVNQNVQLEKAASAGITVAQFSTVLAVKQSFYEYVEDLKLVKVNEDQVTNTKGQLDLATARYNTGIGLLSDLTNANTSNENAKTGLTSARAAAEQSRINLAVQMGIDPRTPINPADSQEAVPASTAVNALTDHALQKRPEVVQAQANLHSALYGVKAARTTSAPVISGVAEVLTGGDSLFPQNNSLLVGVNFSWNLLDGGLTHGAVESAQGSVDTAAAQLTIAQQQVKSDVNNAYILLTSAEQRLVSTKASVADAEEGVRIATGRYATGIGQFQDILTAQALLLTARTDQVTAQEDLQTARATLQHAIGDITP